MAKSSNSSSSIQVGGHDVGDLASVVTPVVGGVATLGLGAWWLKKEVDQQKAKDDKKMLKEALKDPDISQLVQARESLSDELGIAKMMEKTMEKARQTLIEKAGGDLGPEERQDVELKLTQNEKALKELRSYKESVDQKLTEVVSHPKLEALRSIEARHDLAKQQLSGRREHLLSGAGTLRSLLNQANSAVSAGVAVANTAMNVGSPVLNAVGSATVVAGIPLGVAQMGIGAASTVYAAMHLKESIKVGKQAKELRAEFKGESNAKDGEFVNDGDPMLAAVAKRIQMKHDKNRIEHGLSLVSGASSTVAGALSTTAAVAGTVAIATGAGTMGIGASVPGIIAVSAGAGATVVGGVGLVATTGKAAYQVARAEHSAAKKLECEEAINTLRQMKAGGIKQFDVNNAGIKEVLKDGDSVHLIPSGPKVLRSVNDKQAQIQRQDGSSVPAVGFGTDVTPKQEPSVREKMGRWVESKLTTPGPLHVAPGGSNATKGHTTNLRPKETDFSHKQLAAVRSVQKHAVKEAMRHLEPFIKQQADAHVKKMVEDNPGKYSKSEIKALVKTNEKLLAKQLKANVQEQFKDPDKLLNHANEVMVSRDTKTAMNYLAGRLRQDCQEALHHRRGAGIVAADLPNTPAIKLARGCGMDDKQIARIVNAVSQEDTLRAGRKVVTKTTKLS